MSVEKQSQDSLKILLIEDDESFRMAVVHLLGVYNEVTAVGRLSEGRTAIEKEIFDVILMDRQLPDGLSTDCISEFKLAQPKSVLIILTGDMEFGSVKKSLLAGADDYVFKTENIVPDLLVRIPMTIARASLSRKLTILNEHSKRAFKYEIVGKASSTLELREQILSLKGSASHVLITGESGTGKELIARRINAIEDTAHRPFVVMNCGAIPESLFEAELFGYKRGAFTGANQDQLGKFELADGGDLFLDEVGEIPIALQSKLLRVIQDGEFYKLGATKPTRVSVRVIAATNQDLEARVTSKEFREDLYYRLNVVRIKTTPLSRRPEDIADLAKSFLLQIAGPGLEISEEAIIGMQKHAFPGNIRELRNTIERAVLSARRRNSAMINMSDVILDFASQKGLVKGELLVPFLPLNSEDLSPVHYQAFLENLERQYFVKGLAMVEGDVSKLSEKIGLGRSTLFKRLQALQVPRRPYRESL